MRSGHRYDGVCFASGKTLILVDRRMVDMEDTR